MDKQRRGFASMDRDKQRAIASMGGKRAHQMGTAHEWTTDEAREAGRRGGIVSRGGRGRKTAVERADKFHNTHDVDRFADEGNPHA